MLSAEEMLAAVTTVAEAPDEVEDESEEASDLNEALDLICTSMGILDMLIRLDRRHKFLSKATRAKLVDHVGDLTLFTEQFQWNEE